MNGERTAARRRSFHAAIGGSALHAALDVRKDYVAEAVGNRGRASNGGDVHVAVVVVQGQVAANVANLRAAERGSDVRGACIVESDRAVAAGDGGRALHLADRDAPETIAQVQRAFDIGCLHRAVVVVDEGVTGTTSQFDAAEGIVHTRGAKIADRDRTVAIVDIRLAADAIRSDAAETVADQELGIRRNSDVVVHRIGCVPADVDPLLPVFVGINGADANSAAGLLHFDLDLLRVGLGFFARFGLHAYGSGNPYLAAGIAVNVDFAKFVFDLEGLARA